MFISLILNKRKEKLYKLVMTNLAAKLSTQALMI